MLDDLFGVLFLLGFGGLTVAMIWTHLRDRHTHRALRRRIEGDLLAAGFEEVWAAGDDRQYSRRRGGLDVAIALYPAYVTVSTGYRLDGPPADTGVAVLQAPTLQPTAAIGDEALDGLAELPEDEGAGLLLLVARPTRRAALAAFLGGLPDEPGARDRRIARVGHGEVIVESRLSSVRTDPPRLMAEIEAIERAAEAVFAGLDDGVAAELGRAMDDPILRDPLRRRARHRLLLDHPERAPATAAARALLDDPDPFIALGAARLLGDLDHATLRLARNTLARPPFAPVYPLDFAWERLLVALLERFDAERPGAAEAIAPGIADAGIRATWCALLLRGGRPEPAARALMDDGDPDVRLAMAERLGQAPMSPIAEQALIAALDDAHLVAVAAAGALADAGTVASLAPLAAWRDREAPLAEDFGARLEAGLARIRADVDPAMVGQLAISAGEGGGLSVVHTPGPGAVSSASDHEGEPAADAPGTR